MYKKINNFSDDFQDIAGNIFSEADLFALKEHGISVLDAINQFKQMKDGVPSVKPKVAVTEASGFLKVFSEEEFIDLIEKYEVFEFLNPSVYFVPAAGAASRMFRLFHLVIANNAINLEKSLEQLNEKDQKAVKDLFDAIKSGSVAFSHDLQVMADEKGFDLAKAIEEENIVAIFEFMLVEMNYANLPKAVIPVHFYGKDDFRTPLEEHVRFLLELQGSDLRIHLAISPEHQKLIDSEMNRIREKLEKEGIRANINFSTSVQKLSTDAIAYDIDKNMPLHDKQGNLVIRKAGHGSLIKNLDELAKHFDGIFLRNIDNVKPENFSQEISNYKKVMRGHASELQTKIFSFINLLHNLYIEYINDEYGSDDSNFVMSIEKFELINNIINFIREDLKFNINVNISYKSNGSSSGQLKCVIWNVDNSSFKVIPFKNFLEILIDILDRPIAVVAYVPLEPGQKGGGGFVSQKEIDILGHKITVEKATTVEGQELEGGQKNPIFAEQATHFNPVDIYVTTKRFNGESFKLSDFSDSSRAMVDDKELFPGVRSRIWENPGLWNGGMAKMFQISIHAPKETFAPIKEFHDILKPEHKPVVNNHQ